MRSPTSEVTMKFGLALTRNSKVGAAFSLSRSLSCVNKTAVCEKVCYCSGIRYRSSTQKEKRRRNFDTVQLLLQNAGSRVEVVGSRPGCPDAFYLSV